MGFLLGLLWSAPSIELALADVALELRCLPQSTREEVASVTPPRCHVCSAAIGEGAWLCVMCELRLSGGPEVCA